MVSCPLSGRMLSMRHVVVGCKRIVRFRPHADHPAKAATHPGVCAL